MKLYKKASLSTPVKLPDSLEISEIQGSNFYKYLPANGKGYKLFAGKNYQIKSNAKNHTFEVIEIGAKS